MISISVCHSTHVACQPRPVGQRVFEVSIGLGRLLTRQGPQHLLLLGRSRIVLIYHLLEGKRRFSELRRAMPGISQRMLTLDLRALEKAGLVQRTIYPEVPPRVEYDLTAEGRRLRELVDLLGEVGAQLANVEQCAPVRKSAA